MFLVRCTMLCIALEVRKCFHTYVAHMHGLV